MIRWFVATMAFILPAASSPTTQGQHDSFPKRVLWAWERREDLRFLSGTGTGVAFLAVTLQLESESLSVVPRLQPLLTSPDTPLMAVARVETPHGANPALTAGQRSRIVEEVLRVSRVPKVRAIQIDSDATVSERPFFRALLSELRDRLPSTTLLSFTALASWCLGDNWLSGLAADEIVPMLFDMGPDGPVIRRRIASGHDFSSPECRTSLGLATRELIPVPWAGRRVYFFSPEAWTSDSYRRALEGATREPRASHR
ncbi:MAG: hypothetical protein DIJKHBIC_00512 [Thermoanaerobaculia bacterium]|nr:hypothetical protein [Thermoanaerobaculia bacterium]